jgi:hypothetical protein
MARLANEAYCNTPNANRKPLDSKDPSVAIITTTLALAMRYKPPAIPRIDLHMQRNV